MRGYEEVRGEAVEGLKGMTKLERTVKIQCFLITLTYTPSNSQDFKSGVRVAYTLLRIKHYKYELELCITKQKHTYLICPYIISNDYSLLDGTT